MTPDQAALIIQRAWSAYRDQLMASYYAREDEVSFYELYPERPVDYDGMWKVIAHYNDLYSYGGY